MLEHSTGAGAGASAAVVARTYSPHGISHSLHLKPPPERAGGGRWLGLVSVRSSVLQPFFALLLFIAASVCGIYFRNK